MSFDIVSRPIPSGARARIIAPSGPVPAERFDLGLRIVRRHLELDVVLAANIHEQQGYFAGPDAVRLAAIHEAFGDTEAAAILCARGGYGATRLLSALDPERLRRDPKLVVGFSDITALLCWTAVRAGLRSLHGPVVTQLSTLSLEDVQRTSDWLRGEVPSPLVAEEGTVLHGGRVEGTMIAGNLEVLRSLVGTRFFPPMQDAILALEEVGERPYRIDRALTQLLSSGALRGVRGVILGDLIACEEPPDGHLGPSALDVTMERLKLLGVPVVSGFPVGHGRSRNTPLPFGAPVRLDADACTLEFLEPVVRGG